MLTTEKIQKYIPDIKKELGGIKVYTPIRYFQGLKTKAQMKQRIKTMYQFIQEAKKNPKKTKFIKPFKTDKGIKKSARGLLRVTKENGEFVLYDRQESVEDSALELVFRNGHLHRFESISTIRDRLCV